MAETAKLHAGVKDERFRMYNWAFYISHNDRHILWDLGMTDVCGSTPFDPTNLLIEISGQIILHPLCTSVHVRYRISCWPKEANSGTAS